MTCNQSEVLQTVVDEFSNLSIETKNIFIFRNDGETIAKNHVTTEDQTKTFITNIANIPLQTDIIGIIGSLENLTIKAVNGQLNLTTMDKLCLTTVSSKKVNPKILNSLTHVLIPTIVDLLNQQSTDGHQEIQELPPTLQTLPEEEPVEEVVLSEEEPEMDSNFEPESPMEPLLPKPPINQLMIEKIKGVLVSSDTVRVDSEVIESWTELYGDKVLSINIQTLDGKTTSCKFKAVKESKSNAKGIIQIPEKILQTLQASKGQLVMVKPEIE